MILGLAYLDTNDYARALDAFQRAVQVGPQSAEAHNWLGVALSSKADLPGAIAEFRKAVALDPEYGRAYSNLGSALAQSGDYAEAVEVFQRALALEPNSVGAHLNLGMALREKGDLDAALEHLKGVSPPPSRNTPAFSTSSGRRCGRTAILPRPWRPSRRPLSSTRSCAKATTRWARP